VTALGEGRGRRDARTIESPSSFRAGSKTGPGVWTSTSPEGKKEKGIAEDGDRTQVGNLLEEKTFSGKRRGGCTLLSLVGEK